MEKLSSVLELTNELFKKHNDKSGRGAVGPAGRQLGWARGVHLPGQAAGRERRMLQLRSRLILCTFGEGFLLFSQEENHWKLLNPVFKTNKRGFPLSSAEP